MTSHSKGSNNIKSNIIGVIILGVPSSLLLQTLVVKTGNKK